MGVGPQHEGAAQCPRGRGRAPGHRAGLLAEFDRGLRSRERAHGRAERHRLPETVYGISKQAGEQWCAWFRQHHGVDTRSVRYPGLIGELCPPGGGTTDTPSRCSTTCMAPSPRLLPREDTVLRMMHMQDAIGAMLQITSVEADRIRNEEAYNIRAMSFDPATLFAESAGMCRASGPNSSRTSDRPSPTVGRTDSTTPQPARTGAGRPRSPCRARDTDGGGEVPALEAEPGSDVFPVGE